MEASLDKRSFCPPIHEALNLPRVHASFEDDKSLIDRDSGGGGGNRHVIQGSSSFLAFKRTA